MLSHLGFSAWITCEDKPLPEFEVTTSFNRVICWIPSEEGKSFVVNWRDEGSKIETAAYITLDGFVVSGRFLFGEGNASRGGVRTGVSSERPFIFAKVDEARDNPHSQVKSEGKIGTIMLRIKRIRRKGGKKPNVIQTIPEQVRGKRKPGEDCVGYGAERPTECQQPSTWAVEPYDKANPGTFVTFVFRYRSAEFLEAQGIMTSEKGSASPDTPGLSLVSTPSSSNPSPRSSRLRCCTPSEPASEYSFTSEPTQVDHSVHFNRYPGEGLFWFQDNQITDTAEHVDKHVAKKPRTR